MSARLMVIPEFCSRGRRTTAAVSAGAPLADALGSRVSEEPGLGLRALQHGHRLLSASFGLRAPELDHSKA
jgi:hypothetical protein